MRVKLGESNPRLSKIKKFVDWILGIGDGRLGTPWELYERIVIPDDILVKEWDDPIEAFCKVTYPELFAGFNIDDHIDDRAILVLIL
ncbi:hypothetical protein AHAS_Ahas13G0245000 [Arachis hypogaea]